MVDRIYYKNAQEIVIIFTDRSPVTVYHSGGQAEQVINDLFEEANREASAMEETCPGIILLKTA